ncbi:1-phosphatidylinositol 4,5-bisphosphate phosphodiesterase eta-1-like isoform X2 [Salvelinus sp. IW2-2015]|uniref:1-phosphatidylinositol 4,5-bisphosphate phosphodiesterase eta-1-like isoform X2 n=1 Tax=Salvelinus sp. IW2-2015 TaxID=2691554 RepID=UPI0038D4574C
MASQPSTEETLSIRHGFRCVPENGVKVEEVLLAVGEQGKRLPLYLSVDVEEGEVSDDDSADEIEDDFKLKNSNSNGNHQVESYIRKKLDSLLKESQIGDKEDTDSSSIRALLRATHVGLQKNLPNPKEGLKKSQSRSFISNIKQKRHSKSRLKSQSTDGEEEGQETSGREAGGQITRSALNGSLVILTLPP